jgi:hypothetical protein
MPAAAVAVAAMALSSLGASTASATSTTQVALLQAATPVSAGSGWLVWSVPVAGGWGLEAAHGRRVSSLPVNPRPKPFDVDVGTDSRGKPVLTYSRCTRTPQLDANGGEESPNGVRTFPSTGAGCRVHLFSLLSQKESTLPIPHPPGASDTTPSMWHGSIAFGRRDPSHRTVWQVMLWSPRHPHRLSSLRHGAVPIRCPGGCAGKPIVGEVQALDLDAHLLAFVWSIEAPGVFGEENWEERVDDLATGRSSLAGSAVGTESCIEESVPVEEEWPGPPALNGYAALFSKLERGDCYRRLATQVTSDTHRSLRGATLRSPVLELARDGSTIYALVAPMPAGETDPGCSAIAPCVLRRLALPPLSPLGSKPRPPFSEI